MIVHIEDLKEDADLDAPMDHPFSMCFQRRSMERPLFRQKKDMQL